MKKFTFDIFFWIAVASIAIIVCNDFIFSNTTELFNGGAKLGSILENLSLAYISSYIFYIVIFIYRERRDKRNVYQSIYNDSIQLVGRAQMVYSFLAEASENKQAAKYNPCNVPNDFFIDLCKQVNPNNIAKNRGIGLKMNFESEPSSWGKMFHNSCHDQVQYLYSKLMNVAPFLEAEHIMLLNNVINSSYYSATYLFTGFAKNTDFTTQAEEMWEYLQRVNELDNFNKRIFKELNLGNRK